MMKSVNDDDVQNVVCSAVVAACETLDEEFPGFENGGITSNFAYSLELKIIELLVEDELISNE